MRLLHSLLLGSAVLLAGVGLHAQKVIYDTYPSAMEGIFIDNVMLKPSPLDSVKVMDIRIEKGRITALAPELEIPTGYKVIQADTLYGYAGWISLGTSQGLEKEEENDSRGPNNRNDDVHPGNPPLHLSGVTPGTSAADMLSKKEDAFADLNKQGLTIVQVLPEGRMIPGTSVIVHTGESSLPDRIVDRDHSLYAQFRGAENRFYPSTDIGVLALWKDLVNRSRQAADHQKRYSFDETKTPRPNYPEEILALIPVAEKEQSVVFNCSSTLEAIRLNTLAGELNIRILAAGLENYISDPASLSKLEAVGISIDWPKAQKEDKNGQAETTPGFDSTLIAELETARKEALEEQKGLALKLSNADVKFGFVAMGDKVDGFYDNLKELRLLGLSEEDLLEALTTFPAEQMGLSGITGTVEKGKMANLVISDGPVFDENSNLRIVITEGIIRELEKKKSKDSKEQKNAE